MADLNHHHLFIFWSFSSEESFTRTARKLRIAQSAVTSQIRELESSLGLTLIDRSIRRKPVLTDDGRKVAEYAESLFEISSELVKWSKQSEAHSATTLRIGAISGLSRNLQYEFLKPLNSDPRLKIEVITGDQDKLAKLLAAHSIDILLTSHNVPLERRITHYTHVLTSSELVFVTKGGSRKRKGKLREVLQADGLYIPGSTFEARPELDAYLDRLNLQIRIRGEIDDIALLRLFAVESGAVVAVPEIGVQKDIASGKVVVIARARKIRQRFYAITRQRRFPDAAIQRLLSKT